jgi:hypothetical protein
MVDAAKPTARVVASTALAALAAGLVINSGTAYAAGSSAGPGMQTRTVIVAPTGPWQGDDERWRQHDETSDETSITVHSSGSGPVAVNNAGAGSYADQHVDQSIHDSSTHTRYQHDSRTDSHNSSDYRDTHRR